MSVQQPRAAPPPVAHEASIHELLARIDARLGALEAKVEAASAAAAMLPGTVATVTDSVDGAIRSLQSRGVDVDERARAALTLAEKLSEPATLAGLTSLVSLAQSAPSVLATLADSADDLARRAQESGLDIDERARLLLAAGERLTSPAALEALQLLLSRVDALHNVLRSGLLDAPSVAIVARAGRAIAEVAAEPPQRAGVFTMLSALSNEGVQRSLSLALRFAQRLGDSMKETAALSAVASKE